MYLDTAQVIHCVADHTARNASLAVTFVKADGTIRQATLDLAPKSKLKGIGKVGQQNAYVSGYETESGKWVSFDPSKVIALG